MLCDRYSGFPPLHGKANKVLLGGVSLPFIGSLRVEIGHFQTVFCLGFKTGLCVKAFKWKKVWLQEDEPTRLFMVSLLLTLMIFLKATGDPPRQFIGTGIIYCTIKLITIPQFLWRSLFRILNRGYYTVVRRYEFYVRLARTISLSCENIDQQNCNSKIFLTRHQYPFFLRAHSN